MKLCLNILEILSILIIVCLVCVLLISYFENRRLSVTKYRIADSLIPAAFDGYHIVHLTDLHNASFGRDNERLFQSIRQLKPDIILITGDMIIGKPGADVTFAARTVNALCEIAPVYYSLGNHELRTMLYTDTYGSMWKDLKARLSSKVHLLLDERETIVKDGEEVYLYGLNLTPELYRRLRKVPMPQDYLTSLFGKCEPDRYHIFMAHNPEYFKEYADWGANLTFAGHVHGGMIRLPFLGGVLSPMIHFFPKYDKGLFTNNNRYMILSGGLGNHTFKFRVNNLPEIVSVTLCQKSV